MDGSGTVVLEFECFLYKCGIENFIDNYKLSNYWWNFYEKTNY